MSNEKQISGLYCVTCPTGEKKPATLVMYGCSYCSKHYDERVVRINCIATCGVDLANDPKHRHLKVKCACEFGDGVVINKNGKIMFFRKGETIPDVPEYKS